MRRLLAAALLAAALSGCGGEEEEGGGLRAGAADSSPSVTATQEASGPVAGSGCTNDATAGPVTATTDLAAKPVIEVPDGPMPCELDVQDIVKGTGAEAVSGKQITVKYVGVLYADGKEFDSSWGGDDFTFTLGGGQVIGGWDAGFAGMREGGRRQLVIPPDLAYGPGGSGPIPPDATLIFVVDLVKVG